jgi:hypothetical protein
MRCGWLLLNDSIQKLPNDRPYSRFMATGQCPYERVNGCLSQATVAGASRAFYNQETRSTLERAKNVISAILTKLRRL